ncbi:hypothetical protein NECAME_17039, partial [Necator americanus]
MGDVGSKPTEEFVTELGKDTKVMEKQTGILPDPHEFLHFPTPPFPPNCNRLRQICERVAAGPLIYTTRSTTSPT